MNLKRLGPYSLSNFIGQEQQEARNPTVKSDVLWYPYKSRTHSYPDKMVHWKITMNLQSWQGSPLKNAKTQVYTIITIDASVFENN